MQDNQQIEDRRIASERDFHNERFAHEVRQPVISLGQAMERLLLRVPGLRWNAWFSVLEFTK
jgi:hypothetical protein